ncbi:hypothetical protein BKA81DRAFT_383363 [Phyllosticta paracitricarpa]
MRVIFTTSLGPLLISIRCLVALLGVILACYYLVVISYRLTYIINKHFYYVVNIILEEYKYLINYAYYTILSNSIKSKGVILVELGYYYRKNTSGLFSPNKPTNIIINKELE